ncbi:MULTISPECIES: TetR/AcrR family transcriptional regulator [unclassified Saccharothrix]|uniref:TetR/AcrR family transcriptional regulator n=1 Tax=unclassified Saccharothrix TaxID=2593673 RepID=UPI00307F4E6A
MRDRPAPTRADARRNREAILRVADQAFTEEVDVALDEIARRTGLGRATVYRHFPDRTALALAVATRYLATLKDAVRAHRPLRELLHTVLSHQAQRRSLVRVFQSLPEKHRRHYTHALVAALRPAFARAQREGSLRADVEPGDLALLFHMVEAALSADAPRTSVQRLVQVFLDGLSRA